jgi:hypothetical protein
MQCGYRQFVVVFLLLVAQGNARSGDSLKDRLFADLGDGSSSGVDVDQISGELSSLMSDLKLPAAAQKRKSILLQTSAATQDVRAIDLLRAGSENVGGGAMMRDQNRLSAEEKENAHLKKQLAKVMKSNHALMHSTKLLWKQILQGKDLKKKLRSDAAGHISHLRQASMKETKRADEAQKKLTDVEHKTGLKQMAAKILGKQLKSAKSQAVALSLKVNKTIHENKELQQRQQGKSGKVTVESKRVLDERKKVLNMKKGVAEIKSEVVKARASKKPEDAVVAALVRQNILLRQRGAASVKPTQLLRARNSLLKTQLANVIQQEKQLQQTFKRKVDQQLRHDRASASLTFAQLGKAHAAIRELRAEQQRLFDASFSVETAQRAAEDKTKQLQIALAYKEALNKQLKEQTAALQMQVSENHMAAKKAYQAGLEAFEERDAVKDALAGARSKIVQAQGRYAEILQKVVAAQVKSAGSMARADPLLQRQYAKALQAQAAYNEDFEAQLARQARVPH